MHVQYIQSGFDLEKNNMLGGEGGEVRERSELKILGVS